MTDLTGRKVLVVGAGTRDIGDPDAPVGNGRAISVVVGRAGAVVTCADLDTPAAETTADLVRAEGATAHVLTADVTDAAACAGLVEAAAAAMDGLDGLVCNIGVGAGMTVAGTTPEQWDSVFAVNVRSHFLLAQAAMATMPEGGAIVFISSIAGLVPGSRIPAYDSSKSAITGLCRQVAAEGARKGIRANIVAPGLIDTPLGRIATGGRPSRAKAPVPLGRQGTAWEVAEPVAFLLSDAASYITSQQASSSTVDSPAAAADAAPRRRPRRRFERLRVVRAFVFLPGAFSLLMGLVALGAVVLVGALVLDVNYRDGSGAGLGPFESIYLALSLVVVSPVAALPDDGPSRAVYVLIPLAGIILLGQVILRLTVTILNRDRWEAAVASTYSDHVLVCGLGRVGFRVVRWLLDLGEEVVVIDLPDDPEHLHEQVRAWGVPVVTSDARRVEVLEQAGIRSCSALMPITDDDLINLSIATAGRSVRPDLRVVMRTFDDRLADNLQQGFDIYRAYSTSALAAPAFAAAATHAPVDYAFSFGGDEEEPLMLMTITRFTVVDESLIVGWTLGRLEAELDVLVLAHRRVHYQQHPHGDIELEVGDSIVVSATSENLDRLSTFTPPTRELGRYRQGRWTPHEGMRQGPTPTP